MERQIKQILDDDVQLNRLSKAWPEHVIIGIEDNLQPPRNGLAVPIVEFEVEDVDDALANDEEDALSHVVRFHLTHNIHDKSRHIIRNLARKIMRPLRNSFTRHENRFTFRIGDIAEDGVYRFLDITVTLTIWVDHANLNR